MATLLSNITEGSIVKISENGSPVDFYVAKHNYEPELNGLGRTLLVRKDCYDERAWHNDPEGSEYPESSIDAWLNSDYVSLLDANLRKAIGSTAFYYVRSDSLSESTLSRGAFLLSMGEFGNSTTGGTTLPIVNVLEIANLNRTAIDQWTRSTVTDSAGYVYYLNTDGDATNTLCTANCGVRPVFTLPAAETYISDDGTVQISVPNISGEDASFGAQHADFTIAYTVTTTDSSAATVTEKVDDTVIRTYTAQSGAAQSMTVSIADLTAGEHTITITADLNGATAERRYSIVVSSILLAYDETELGVKNTDFSIPYSAVENTDADITITEYLDGVVQRRYVAPSGSQQSMDVSVDYLVDGDHTITIQAESGGETTSATFNFAVPAYSMPAGGTIQEFQDYEGKPVLPVTIARAVLTESGQSVEAVLKYLAAEAAVAELVD